MSPTFELVETAPHPSPALRIALLSEAALHRQSALSASVTAGVRTRFPVLGVDGPQADRLRLHLERYADAESIWRWLHEIRWQSEADRDWIRAQRGRAWRRLRHAVQRVAPTEALRPLLSSPPPPGFPVVRPVGFGDRTAPFAYWPRARGLELYAFLRQLPARRRPTRRLFDARGKADLWDWVEAQRSYSPTREPHPWRAFIAPGINVGMATQLLPAWLGIIGAAPVDARTALFVLEELGLARTIEDLSAAWDRALQTDSQRVPRAALTLWPAHGSWWALLLQLVEWRRQTVAEHSSPAARDPGRRGEHAFGAGQSVDECSSCRRAARNLEVGPLCTVARPMVLRPRTAAACRSSPRETSVQS